MHEFVNLSVEPWYGGNGRFGLGDVEAAVPFPGVRNGDGTGIDVGRLEGLPATACEVEGVLLHTQAGAVVIAAPQGDDVAHEGGEVFQAGKGGVVRIAVPVCEGDADAGGEQPGGVVGHEGCEVFPFGSILHRCAGVFEEVAAGLPFAETAEAPFGEVLLAHGPGIEKCPKDFLHFGKGVEPVDDLVSGMVAVEAAVQFIADVAGKTGDFAGADHGEGEFGSPQRGE